MERYYRWIRKCIIFFHMDQWMKKDKKTKEAIDILYRKQEKEKAFWDIWCQRILYLIGGCILCGLALLGCMVSEEENIAVTGNTIDTQNSVVTVDIVARDSVGKIRMEQMTFPIESYREKAKEQVETAGVEADVVPTLSPEERQWQEVRQELQKSVENQSLKQEIYLPQKVKDMELEYKNPEKTTDYSLFYLSLFLIVLIPFLWGKKQKDEIANRDSQLLMDYPEIVNKVMLLLGAGLTIRGAFGRMGREYQEVREKGGEKRYAYEEISSAYQDMQNGVPEADAVENFGKRCRQISYLRFSSILTQNIRKGSEGLIRMLETESIDAFEKRKETVKALGEKAGTKLLFPMILMLGMVMAIIMVPAFMTM